ncbi:respiratory nitrate reductase 1 subunit alpha [Escherichia coli]|uniref:Respiratory nitrate reductase 1 subunit alpha n=1 Tax=Escherichia coli TaxID=562 RepID=A0A376L5S4_ECOLX|nr:respiratory nitrate reductase 1 subunit alpha [Escherichia coli]
MSKFLDRFRYFKQKGETFADGHGQLLNTNRDWEDGYRQRWQHGQNRPLYPRGKLHRLLQLENLRQKRSGDLGNPAD